MQQITANVYIETKYRGANTGFVTTAEGLVMIDTPYRPSDALRWRDELARNGDVRYLINTEPHIDHFTGNYFFPGTVVSHEETREAIKRFPLEKVMERVRGIDPDAVPLMAEYQVRIPTITFSHGLSLYLGDQTFELFHLPGHTMGVIAVHIPQERVVFTGDNVFHRVQPFLHECDPFLWLQSLKTIEEIDVDIIVPGHGEICDKSYIPELSSFIQEWVDTVRRAIAQGLSKEEAMEKISFLDRYPMGIGQDAMGPDVQRWNVERLYNLLTM
jgi:glyoxylase-like metal-dependent hydrolase (beta-lactamase superfamily II)